MQISQSQRQHIISSLSQLHDDVVRRRAEDSDDMSSKWNDSREKNARRLDKERDELKSLIAGLSKSNGSISW